MALWLDLGCLVRALLVSLALAACSSTPPATTLAPVAPPPSQVAGETALPAADSGTQVHSMNGTGAAPLDAGHADEDAGSIATPVPDAAAPTSPAPAFVIEPHDDASYIFDQQHVRTYNIAIAATDLAKIDANPQAEADVPAMLEFEGTTYGPYQVRYKGSVGAWRPPCTTSPLLAKTGKCSLKLDFNQNDPNARFFGLKKLNLHSMNDDSAELRDRLSYAMFREMGVVAPRAMHARVLINGKLEGLFVAVEQIDGRFTRARFGDGGEGNVYKEIWPNYDDPSMYVNALETNADEHPSVQRMLDFRAAIADSAQSVERFIDRDYIMRYTAVDRVIINDDGIFHWWCDTGAQGNNVAPYGNHNYYWYEAKDSERLWLIPWDLDDTFTDASHSTHIEIPWTQTAPCVCKLDPMLLFERPASCDPLTKYFISWLPEYEAKVDAFIAGPFAAGPVDAKLNDWSAQIDQYVREASGKNGAPTYSAWMMGVEDLRQRIADARKNRGYAYKK
jgi:hypothetical protein